MCSSTHCCLSSYCRRAAVGEVDPVLSDAVVYLILSVSFSKKLLFLCMFALLTHSDSNVSVFLSLACTSLPLLTSSLPGPSSPFAPLVFCFITCPAPHQPLSFSAAGVGEGEGKPRGADGALFQGAAGSSCLRQHQERRLARPDVRQISGSF